MASIHKRLYGFYEHLDPFDTEHFDLRAGGDDHRLLAPGGPYLAGDIDLALSLYVVDVPVSYTHLDVYKRQHEHQAA